MPLYRFFLYILVTYISLFLPTCVPAEDLQQPLAVEHKKPNIVFILTDDQDLHMDSLSYMPYLQKELVDRGVSFSRHYCTVALCCPSRVSMWTGKAARKSLFCFYNTAR